MSVLLLLLQRHPLVLRRLKLGLQLVHLLLRTAAAVDEHAELPVRLSAASYARAYERRCVLSRRSQYLCVLGFAALEGWLLRRLGLARLLRFLDTCSIAG